MGDPADPVDRALRDLDESWTESLNDQPAAEAAAVNDRTIAGLGVGTPLPMPVAPAPRPDPDAVADPLAQLESRARPPTDEPPELAHAEQSPLAFVMRASEPSKGPQQEQSHDMSMFVEGLVAGTKPVVETVPAQTAMEPIMRRSRKQRHWIVASAVAATAIVGALVGVHFAAKKDPPPIAAKQVRADVAPPSSRPAVAQTPPPAAPAATTVEKVAPATDVTPPSNVAPPSVDLADTAASTTSAPTATPVVAIAETTAKTPPATKAASTTSAKKVASKKLATANTTAKKSPKKSSAKKSAVAKKTTAKKPTTKKKTRR